MTNLFPARSTIMLGEWVSPMLRDRQKRERWDRYFYDLARVIARKSKDRSTQVGAVFVAPDHAILSAGWNGFPRGVNDDVEARHQRPAKYDWMVHAESNAIANAARHGIRLADSTLYVTQMPCGTRCAGEIVQSGVRRVVTVEPCWDDPHLCANHKIGVSRDILTEGGVELSFLQPDTASETPDHRQMDLFGAH